MNDQPKPAQEAARLTLNAVADQGRFTTSEGIALGQAQALLAIADALTQLTLSMTTVLTATALADQARRKP